MPEVTKEQVVEYFSGLPKTEVVALISELDSKLDFLRMFAPGVPGEDDLEEGQRWGFDVTLVNVGPNKLQVVKLIRELTSLGLQDSKRLMDNVPQVVYEAAGKDLAYEIRERFRELGATVTLT